MNKTLILGYGNPDRQDDGVAWHILSMLGKKYGREVTLETVNEITADEINPAFLFQLQLTPELAEDIAEYERVCFIDAHTGNIPEEVSVSRIQPNYQQSPFTHHLTPQTCLALCETLSHRVPDAILVSVRGYEFGFSHQLSTKTSLLADEATKIIWDWLNANHQD